MEIEEKYLIAFFGRQADYYVGKYEAYKAGKRFSFNVGTFLGGLFWFLYRKLYKELSIVLVVIFLDGILEEFLYSILRTRNDTKQLISIMISVVTWILLGFIGNFLYIRSSEIKISKIIQLEVPEEEKLSLLTVKGGITWLGIGACLIIAGAIIGYFFYKNNY